MQQGNGNNRRLGRYVVVVHTIGVNILPCLYEVINNNDMPASRIAILGSGKQ